MCTERVHTSLEPKVGAKTLSCAQILAGKVGAKNLSVHYSELPQREQLSSVREKGDD